MSGGGERSMPAPAPATKSIGQFRVWVPVEVRFSDLDTQGHVNNALHLTYFEQGRIGYFSAVRRLAHAHLSRGASVAVAERTHVLRIAPAPTHDRLELPLVVSEASVSYRRPIESLAPVSVGVRAARIGRASLVLEYAIRSAPEPDGHLYATGSTTIVCVDRSSGRPRGLPHWTLEAVQQLERDG